MHDLIIPPEPPQPKRHGPPARLPVEIVIDRRGARPVRYGLIAALIGLAGLAATHFYAPDRSKDAAVQKAEAQAPSRSLSRCWTKRRSVGSPPFKIKCRNCARNWTPWRNDKRPTVFARSPPAPLRPLSKTKPLLAPRKLRP